ncbi:diacylglycerol kinase family protein, partial [Lishizhenia sp.]|uniref:diacylglycerol kinase family protein n=1 Tax=Lishizhenia sp. TaxID=2497594 RepID=UPI0039AEAA3B
MIMNVGFKYGFKGIKRMLQTEKNFKIHVVLFLLLIGASFFFEVSKFEWCILLALSALV